MPTSSMTTDTDSSLEIYTRPSPFKSTGISENVIRRPVVPYHDSERCQRRRKDARPPIDPGIVVRGHDEQRCNRRSRYQVQMVRARKKEHPHSLTTHIVCVTEALTTYPV
jgi:hypothetical protein